MKQRGPKKRIKTISIIEKRMIFSFLVFGGVVKMRFRSISTYLTDVFIESPLREHPEDIEELVYYYIGQNSFTYAKAIRHISPEVVERLISYNWPGNVRELFHVLDYVLNVIDDDTIRPEHLPDFLFNEKGVEEKALPAMQQEYAHQTLQETMDEFEGEVLRLALKEYNYNITQTAQALGIHRQGLQYRIKKYGIIV